MTRTAVQVALARLARAVAAWYVRGFVVRAGGTDVGYVSYHALWTVVPVIPEPQRTESPAEEGADGPDRPPTEPG